MTVVKTEVQVDTSKLPKPGFANGAVTPGADPEIFVFAEDKLLPAFEFLPSKDAPAVGMETQSYWDGFQAEFRLLHPGYFCLMFHTRRIHDGLRTILRAARMKASSANLVLDSVVEVPPSMLAEAIDPHVELGCMPSENAYGLRGALVEDPRKLKYRFAGGHMHFGQSAKYDYAKSVKTLDKILGVWSVGAAQSFDVPTRRKYYGMAGEYRMPKYAPIKHEPWYGLEYRVLSNFYLCSPLIHHLTWEIARRVVSLAQSEFADVWIAPEEEVIECIQNCDVKIARDILKRNEPMFKWLFGIRGWSVKTVQRGFDVGLNGIESEIKDPTDIEKNWFLSGSYDAYANNNPTHTWYGHCMYGAGRKG